MQLLRQLINIGILKSTGIGSVVPLPVSIYSNPFSLTDKNACNQCFSRMTKQNQAFTCNRETLNVKPLNPVAVLYLDPLFNSLKITGLKNCDYIMGDAVNMYASRKIAFCDLTCSDPKYINPGGSTKYPQGKRNYILEQIEDTAKWLMSDLMIYHCLSTATCRQIIIGIRHNNIQVTSSPATAMKAFTQTPSSTANSLTTKQIIKSISFDIVEITYPTPLEW